MNAIIAGARRRSRGGVRRRGGSQPQRLARKPSHGSKVMGPVGLGAGRGGEPSRPAWRAQDRHAIAPG